MVIFNDVIRHMNHHLMGEHLNAQAIQGFVFFVGSYYFSIRD